MSAFRDQLLQDLRYAGRIMAAQPLFTAMAALSLALGIGANTAIYSFMDAILMRALPVQNPESLVVFNWHAKERPPVIHSSSGSQWHEPRLGLTSGNMPYGFFEEVRAARPVFSSVFGFAGAGTVNAQIRGQADLARTQYVSGDFFSGLGVPPAAGRLIDPADDREGAPLTAAISHGYAQRRFGDPAKAVGQRMLINGNPFTIAGVTAPEFFGVNPAGAQDIYVPMHTSILLESIFGPRNPRAKFTANTYYWIQMMARLRPGVSRERAEAAMVPLFRNFADSAAVNAREHANLPLLILKEGAGGLDFLRRQYSKPLYVLMTLVALILAIACANIANLLLARATARRREMALRLSLGAGRMRVVRQLLTESVTLGMLGGALGVVVAKWGIGALTLLLANGQENFTLHAALNWHVLALTVGLSVATGMFFGLAPALQSTQVDLVSALKQTRSGDRTRRLHRRIRLSLSQALAVAQIAISLLLLVAAGLFVRTLGNLHSVALGFNRENLLLATLNARQAGYQDAALMRFYDGLRNQLRGIPGVRAVTLSNYAMVSNSENSTDVHIPGQSGPNPGTDVLNVGPRFFSTMQIPIVLGHEIEERDAIGSTPVAVVNEIFAHRYFGADNPVGRHFILGGGAFQIDFEILGVSRTARLVSLKDEISPTIYVAYNQNPRQSLGSIVYEIRAAGDPAGLSAAVRRIVREADPRVPISSLITQERVIEQTIGQERTFAMLCTCFAVLAALIAFVGLYGLMAYSVARRTNEIGIRMALGAERRRLMWMVLREVLAMAVLGLAIGLPIALAATRFVGSFLFQMRPNDPIALTAAAVALLAASVLAGYGPAWRASRIDPWTALRDE
ncbi:MAG: ABC transporter permease [Bryobacteraceae bacterium]